MNVIKNNSKRFEKDEKGRQKKKGRIKEKNKEKQRGEK